MTYLCVPKYMFGITLYPQQFSKSIYGFTVLQTENWPRNLRYCIFDLNFAQILSLFAYFRSPMTYICLSKYIFGIGLFAQPFFQSIYGFPEFQMEHWPQNLLFSIFDPLILPFRHIFHHNYPLI